MHFLVGRLTADPELRYTQDGIAVTKFRIAVNRSYKSKDGSRPADFFTVVAWRERAEVIAKYFSKGRMIAVRGPQYMRKYTDRDGNQRTVYELNLEEFSFCDSSSQNGASSPKGQGRPDNFGDNIPFNDDDIPF